MHISDFDYDLPQALIAQHPLIRRDASRMLVVDRQAETWTDSEFSNFPDYLSSADVLVLNNTRVFAARLKGNRLPSGGAVEVLLLRRVEGTLWQALCKPARRLRAGARISFGNGELHAEIQGTTSDGRRVISFNASDDLDVLIDRLGEPPLPPYIKRSSGSSDEDRARYQTVYAKERGAIAAPTAGLHFTPAILDRIKTRDVAIAEVTLHVGYGTFEPVHVEELKEHRVAPEEFSISENTADLINSRRTAGGRIFAVGTTTTRALESSVSKDGRITATLGRETNITILPGHRFAAVDALLTNFHLPKSSLLMMVSAFAGRELVLAAYRHAVQEEYRFYSYGDCMLIV